MSFLSLSDTPASYSGDAGKILSVDGGESGVVFSETVVGANTATDGSSVAFGSGSSASSTGSVVLGPDATTDVAESFVTTSIPLVPDTSAVGPLGDICTVGTLAVIMSKAVDLSESGEKFDVTFPSGTLFYPESIESIGLTDLDVDRSIATVKVGNGDENDYYLNRVDFVGAIKERRAYGLKDLENQGGTDRLTVKVTSSSSRSAFCRIVFHGIYVKSE